MDLHCKICWAKKISTKKIVGAKNLLVQKYQRKKLSFKKTKIAQKLDSKNLGARKFQQKKNSLQKKIQLKKNLGSRKFFSAKTNWRNKFLHNILLAEFFFQYKIVLAPKIFW